MLRRFTDLRQGEIVSVWDDRLLCWREGRVLGVNHLRMLFTAEVGGLVFDPRPIHPRFVRRIRLVYCQRCSEMRARRAA